MRRSFVPRLQHRKKAVAMRQRRTGLVDPAPILLHDAIELLPAQTVSVLLVLGSPVDGALADQQASNQFAIRSANDYLGVSVDDFHTASDLQLQRCHGR